MRDETNKLELKGWQREAEAEKEKEEEEEEYKF